MEAEVVTLDGVSTNRQTIALAKDAALWSEFTPVLHEIEVRVGNLSRRMRSGGANFAPRRFSSRGIPPRR